MRPISLTIAAFGSYDLPQTIDFTGLAERGIFLICGNTGGGKTTILDAVSMALYGKATGVLRNKQSKIFRNRSSERSTNTVVDLTFALGDTTYRFYRSWRIGKQQGEDVLKEHELACYTTAPGGEPELTASGSARALEAAAESILGLTHEQFVKVICLPQGEFRELLTTDSTTRTVIFERLFGTDRWKLIASAAARRVRDVGTRLLQNRERTDALLAGTGFENVQILRLEAERAEKERLETEAQLKEISDRLAAAESVFAAATVINDRFKQLDIAVMRLETLEQSADDMAITAAMLERNAALSELLPKYSRLEEAKADEESAVKRLAACHDAEQKAAALLGDAVTRCENIDRLRARVEQTRLELSRLQAFKAKADELNSIAGAKAAGESALQSCNEQLEANTAQETALVARIEKGRALIAECDEKLALANEAARAQSEAAAQLERIRELRSLEAQTARAESELRKAQESYDSAAAEAERLRQILTALEQQSSADAAYVLSKSLSDGTPCPVCGSLSHPSPACPPSGAPDPKLIEDTRARFEKARAALEQATVVLSDRSADHRLRAGQLEQKRAENTGDITLEQAEKALAEATALMDEINRFVQEKPKYLKLMDELTAQQQQLHGEAVRLSAEKAQHMADISAASARLNALTSELESEGVNINDIDKEIALRETRCSEDENEIKDAQSALDTARVEDARARSALEAARADRDTARERLTALTAEYAAECAERMVDIEECIPNMLLEHEQERELRQQLDTYNADVLSARRTRERLAHDLEGQSRQQIDDLQAIRDGLSGRVAELSAQQGAAAERARSLAAAVLALDETEREHERLSADYSAIKTLSDRLNGSNVKKTPIDQFVAGLLLDEIINAANGYWNRLSRGQYALRRREDAVGRQRYQGVDFEVIDAHIGQAREVYTLSGGELFLASLSLAFGLSDVVQGFSGAARLDSIFIDEGFGSLDHESLELAMRAIGEIREGRLVGIISHVDDLRVRIGARIEVSKDENGSHARVIL